MQSWLLRIVARADKWPLAQELNRVMDSGPEPEGNFRQVFREEVITKLADNIIQRCLPKENLHRRWLS